MKKAPTTKPDTFLVTIPTKIVYKSLATGKVLKTDEKVVEIEMDEQTIQQLATKARVQRLPDGLVFFQAAAEKVAAAFHDEQDTAMQKQLANIRATYGEFDVFLEPNGNGKVTWRKVVPQHLTEADIEAMLEQNWGIIASLAWKGYKEDGRGFLLMEEIPPKRVAYYAYRDHTASSKDEYKLDTWVQEYDPAKEAIILVRCAALPDVACFRLSQQPTPPEAYEQRRAILERK